MRALLCSFGLVLLTLPLSAAEIEFIESVKFDGRIEENKDVSALGLIGEFLVVGSDETELVQVLKANGAEYKVHGAKQLTSVGKEIDIEAIACDPARRDVFVLGSHCFNRQKPKLDKTVAENLAGLNKPPDQQPNRMRLMRLRMDANGKLSDPEVKDLRPALAQFPLLKEALLAPSKENGVDFEGLSCAGDMLYAGFRGPVLVEGYALVLRFKFEDAATTGKLLFVHLGGRGIRDMVKVADGHLILAGPVGDGPGSYQIYHWDGVDCLAGSDLPNAHKHCRLLGELPPLAGNVEAAAVKAEGLAVEDESQQQHYKVLVVYDGLREGAPSRYRVPK